MKKKIEAWSYLLIAGIFLICINGCENNKKGNLENSSDDQATSNDSASNITINNNDSLTDIDGNVYQTITIGTQVWMAENLKVTRFRNGDKIPLLKDDAEWSKLTSGEGYCNYDQDESQANIYGRLYNWHAVNDARKIAPEGWHVPSDAEWAKMVNFLGGISKAGGILKITGTTYWDSPNTGATNQSGFSAVAAGERNNNGMFTNRGFSGGWWTTRGSDGDFATNYGITCNSEQVVADIDDMRYGYSVRCVKD